MGCPGRMLSAGQGLPQRRARPEVSTARAECIQRAYTTTKIIRKGRRGKEETLVEKLGLAPQELEIWHD